MSDNSQLVELLKQNQISREAQFASDIQQLRAELTLSSALHKEQAARAEQLQEALGTTRLELQTALAASQIRVEALQQSVSDQRAELVDLRHQNGLYRSQLDAARDNYLDVQRKATDFSDQVQKLTQQNVELQLQGKLKLETFRQAVIGASNVLSSEVSYNAIIDTLVEAGDAKGSKTDYILAKLARTAKEKELLQTKLVQSEKDRVQLEQRVQRYEQNLKLAGGSLTTPSIQMLYDEINNREQLVQHLEQKASKLETLLKAAEDGAKTLQNELKRKDSKIKEMRANLAEVGELRKTVRAMIAEEAGK